MRRAQAAELCSCKPRRKISRAEETDLARSLFEARRITCSLAMQRAPMARLFVNCRRRFAAPVDTPYAMLPASAVQIPQGLLEAMRWRFSHPGFGARAVGHFLALAGMGGPEWRSPQFVHNWAVARLAARACQATHASSNRRWRALSNRGQSGAVSLAATISGMTMS